MGFKDEVFTLVAKVPCGFVVTYGDVASYLKKPGAARAVGQALHQNKDINKVPCHRVVAASGKLGGYVWGALLKEKRLQREGVIVKRGKLVNFASRRYTFGQ